ncbi:MAG: endonuclease III [Deltaproteobacteria bacterium]|nr:endonuclease III [Deltaproteobacteria bacterium]
MRNADLIKVFSILKKEYSRLKTPAVTVVSERTKDPFRVLVSCVISLRTKDDVTARASARLFERAKTLAKMAALTPVVIEKLIYPAGFYRTKAKVIRNLSLDIIKKYNGSVPDSIDELLTLKGVGRKTANLVVTLGFGKPGICVDVHVHRITNRWGYVRTKNPEATEFALRKKLPGRYWIPINDYLVAYGQNICTPVSPRCSECAIFKYCKRVGVGKRR